MALERPSLLRATCILRHYCVASRAVVSKDVPYCIHQQCCNDKPTNHLHNGYSADYWHSLRKMPLPKQPVPLHSTLKKATRSCEMHSCKQQTTLKHVVGFNSQLPYRILRDRHRLALGLRDDLSLVSSPIVPLSVKVIQELQSLTVPNSSPHSTPTSSSVCNTRILAPQLQSVSAVRSTDVSANSSSTEQLLCSEVQTNSGPESNGKDLLNPQRPTPAQLSFVLLKLREEVSHHYSCKCNTIITLIYHFTASRVFQWSPHL